MNALRRIAVLFVIAVVTVLGLTAGPALAAFGDQATMPLTVGTTTVVAPSNLSTGGTKCVTSYDSWGRAYTTLQAKVSWQPSTTAKVTSYDVMAWASGWSYLVTTVDGSATSVSGSYDSYYATQNIQVTIIAHTSYGWTAQSAKSGVIKC